jgi:hypothetical protein
LAVPDGRISLGHKLVPDRRHGLAVFDSQLFQLAEPESATLERGTLHPLT